MQDQIIHASCQQMKDLFSNGPGQAGKKRNDFSKGPGRADKRELCFPTDRNPPKRKTNNIADQTGPTK